MTIQAEAAPEKKKSKSTKKKKSAKSKKRASTEVAASRPKPAPRKWECPEGNASFKGDKPLLFALASPVNHLAVCGKKLETGEYSGFDIYRVRGNVTKSNLFSGGAMDRYHITSTLDGLKLVELMDIQGTWQPVIERQIECTDEKACKIVEKGCIFSYARKNAEIPENAKTALEGSVSEGSGKIESITTEGGVQGIADMAFGGNKMAQLYFMDNKGSDKLEPTAKTLYDTTVQLLTQLERKNCLP
jgi:hypothetical protein